MFGYIKFPLMGKRRRQRGKRGRRLIFAQESEFLRSGCRIDQLTVEMIIRMRDKYRRCAFGQGLQVKSALCVGFRLHSRAGIAGVKDRGFGHGLALLIETLSGILTGAAFTWRVRSWMTDDHAAPTEHGAGFIVVDADAMMPAGAFGRRMETLIDEIHAAPRADGIERIYVPGEMEWERYDRAMQEGIRLPPDVVASLREAAALVGMDLSRDLG